MSNPPLTGERIALSNNPLLRYVTFFYLYVMQGIPAGFALTALANYLIGKDVSSEKVGAFIAYVGLPWILQFVWGPIIDRYQLSSMGNRKHWVVGAQWAAVLVTMCFFFVKVPEREISLLSLLFFIHSIFASIQVASVDAMAIITAPVNERGKVNGFMRGGFLLGIAFGSTVLSIVLHSYGFRVAAIIQTVSLIALSIAFFFTRIEPNNTLLPSHRFKSENNTVLANPAFREVFRNILIGITRAKSLRYFLVVSVVYCCASVFIRSYTFHLINVMHWSDKTVSILQGGWGSIVTFIAIIVAGIKADQIGAKKMQITVMWVVCIYLVLVNATFTLWNFNFYAGSALVLWNLADPLLSVAIFPILMGLCLEKVEGSQFTTYLALINLCDVLGSYLTGWGLQVVPAPVLGLSCGVALLLVLIRIGLRNKYQVIPEPAILR
jgi:MFS transporter, PAT family, beta-lactamase induction signal transducer AmpG